MQAQMIYPQSNVAAMIAGRLSKSKGFDYVVTKVLTGFLVAPVAQPGKTNAEVLDGLLAKVAPTYAAEQVWTMNLPYKSESKEWLCALRDGHTFFWVPKSALISWETIATPTGLQFILKMPVAYAKKRGLIPK